MAKMRKKESSESVCGVYDLKWLFQEKVNFGRVKSLWWTMTEETKIDGSLDMG